MLTVLLVALVDLLADLVDPVGLLLVLVDCAEALGELLLELVQSLLEHGDPALVVLLEITAIVVRGGPVLRAEIPDGRVVGVIRAVWTTVRLLSIGGVSGVLL